MTPSAAASQPALSPETIRAFDELRRAAAKMMNADPDQVTLTICRANPIEAKTDDEEFFYARHSF